METATSLLNSIKDEFVP